MHEQYVILETLKTYGIKVDAASADALLLHINTTVEERIGAEITDSLTEAQIKELIALQENGNEDRIGEWITREVPNYAEIVQSNIDAVLGEMVESTENINQM